MREAWRDLFEDGALAAAGCFLGADEDGYPLMPAPPYRPMASESWRLSQVMLAGAPGYFGGHQRLDAPTYILTRDQVAWMSLLPSEVESQQPHLAAASGVVVVCGLGLGLMAYAVSALKRVERLVVVERDAELAEVFRAFAGFEGWPQRDKVEIVIQDARDFAMAGVDFLYIDIWPYLRMDAMIEDTKAISRNTPAALCGYWGQELDIVDAAAAEGVGPEALGPEHVEAFARRHGLPLLGVGDGAYPEMCRRAALGPSGRRPRIPVAA